MNRWENLTCARISFLVFRKKDSDWPTIRVLPFIVSKSAGPQADWNNWGDSLQQFTYLECFAEAFPLGGLSLKSGLTTISRVLEVVF